MKKCKYCGNCKRVYKRYYLKFYRDKYLYCTEKEEITEPDNGCKNWRINKKEYDVSSERFKKAEEDVKFLLQYFAER